MKPCAHTVSLFKRIQMVAVVLAAVCFTLPVNAGWKRIGFAGLEIHDIAIGRDALRQQEAAVFVPVSDSGIFVVSVLEDSINGFPYKYSASDRPVGVVHSLHVSANGTEALAGTDSGLYMATLYSAALPAWRKVTNFPTEPVFCVTRSDSFACAITASGVYRSKGGFAAWSPCTLSGVFPLTGGIRFSALTVWPHGGFAVSSISQGNPPGFSGVYFGGSSADSWSVISDIAGCTDLAVPVYAMSTDSAGMLYAGTANGVYYGCDFDTGCWHPMAPQLSMPINDVQPWIVSSSGLPPDLVAATDSGIYLRLNSMSSDKWAKLLDLKTFAVEVVVTDANVRILYAATADGLWKYDPTAGVTASGVRSSIQGNRAGSNIYTLDGKVLPHRAAGNFRGIGIVTNDGRSPVPVVRCCDR